MMQFLLDKVVAGQDDSKRARIGEFYSVNFEHGPAGQKAGQVAYRAKPCRSLLTTKAVGRTGQPSILQMSV
jgi:hypothetical protein